MADIRNRGKLEGELSKELAKLSAKQLEAITQALGTPPNPSNIPAAFWKGYSAELSKILLPFLQKVYAAQSEAMRESVAVEGVDWKLVNVDAAQWAEQYTFDLVKGIKDTTESDITRAIRDELRDTIAQGITDSLSTEDLADLLEPSFGVVRAEMIAVTETTRAAAQGEAAIVAELAKQGFEMVAIWNTNEDEFVCPICSGLDTQEAVDGVFTDDDGNEYDMPPAHPRCRCFVTHDLAASD